MLAPGTAAGAIGAAIGCATGWGATCWGGCAGGDLLLVVSVGASAWRAARPMRPIASPMTIRARPVKKKP